MILNYSTSISVVKTAGEIHEILVKAGANRVTIEYDKSHTPDGISFQIEVNANLLSYRLPIRWNGVFISLKRSKADRRYRTEEQAKRVAWRIVKNQIEVELATIEAGVSELAEVFLPYMINPVSGETVYDSFKTSGFMLGDGRQHDE